MTQWGTRPLHLPDYRRVRRPPVPLEHEELAIFLQWCALQTHRWPDLALIYASPQGEIYRRAHGRPRVLGLKPGIPDVHLPVARCGFYGWWCEMKRLKGGRLSGPQSWWGEQLRAQGHRVVVCHGAERAILHVTEYVSGPRTHVEPVIASQPPGTTPEPD